MNSAIFLILFPSFVGILALLFRNSRFTDWIVRIGAAAIAVCSVYTAVLYFSGNRMISFDSELVSHLLLSVDICLAILIAVISIRKKRYDVFLIDIAQSALICWNDLFGPGSKNGSVHHIFIDKLTVIMVLIIGVIGGLICIFAVSYMKDYHAHHKDIKDRRSYFFALLFFFLSAMFGIVLFYDLSGIYVFWEITTVCSFLLIGYTKSKEAQANSFYALLMNLIGGLCFACAIVYLSATKSVVSMSDLLALVSDKGIVIPVILLSVAALTKAAQMPFSKWLLGAMVAPTPSSALLHSSTMVKAGVYLLIRMAPLLTKSIAGTLVTGVGGFTFLAASLIAISQSDAKKILAYSTIANLGLIVACAGAGTYEATWAAIMLIIFHAVSKSLLFLTVGKTEHVIGSRDVEDMHGLIIMQPTLALLLAIGIAGMFLAPFGMLISKWAALKAFIDSNNIIIVLMTVYGSAVTLFYWAKWLGKIASIMPRKSPFKVNMKSDEAVSLYTLAFATTFICFLYPLLSKGFIRPYLDEVFGSSNVILISNGSQIIMSVMLGMIILLPFAIRIFTSKKENITTVYMSGINCGDNRTFESFDGTPKKMYLSTWYMKGIFGEDKLLKPFLLISLSYILVVAIIGIGGALI